jgi:hypothetical protein
MRSTRKIPLAAAILSAGLALAAAQEAGCASTDACPDSGPPTVGATCIGDQVCRYETHCGGEFQCIGGVWIANTKPNPGCDEFGGSSPGTGGNNNAGGFSGNGGGTTTPGTGGNAGGSSAGGSNAGGSSAGGSHAGGSNAGGNNAGGSPAAGGGGAAASSGTN